MLELRSDKTPNELSAMSRSQESSWSSSKNWDRSWSNDDWRGDGPPSAPGSSWHPCTDSERARRVTTVIFVCRLGRFPLHIGPPMMPFGNLCLDFLLGVLPSLEALLSKQFNLLCCGLFTRDNRWSLEFLWTPAGPHLAVLSRRCSFCCQAHPRTPQPPKRSWQLGRVKLAAGLRKSGIFRQLNHLLNLDFKVFEIILTEN